MSDSKFQKRKSKVHFLQALKPFSSMAEPALSIKTKF